MKQRAPLFIIIVFRFKPVRSLFIDDDDDDDSDSDKAQRQLVAIRDSRERKMKKRSIIVLSYFVISLTRFYIQDEEAELEEEKGNSR